MGLGWMGLSSYIFLNGWNGYNVAIPNLKGIYILQPCLKLLPCFMCGTLQCICVYSCGMRYGLQVPWIICCRDFLPIYRRIDYKGFYTEQS